MTTWTGTESGSAQARRLDGRSLPASVPAAVGRPTSHLRTKRAMPSPEISEKLARERLVAGELFSYDVPAIPIKTPRRRHRQISRAAIAKRVTLPDRQTARPATSLVYAPPPCPLPRPG